MSFPLLDWFLKREQNKFNTQHSNNCKKNLLSSFAPNELLDKLSALTISGFIWKLLKPSETIALPTSRAGPAQNTVMIILIIAHRHDWVYRELLQLYGTYKPWSDNNESLQNYGRANSDQTLFLFSVKELNCTIVLLLKVDSNSTNICANKFLASDWQIRWWRGINADINSLWILQPATFGKSVNF